MGYVNRVEVVGGGKSTHLLVHATWHVADVEPVLSLEDGEVRNIRRLERGAIDFELHAPRFTKGGFFRLNIDAQVNGHREHLLLENGELPTVHIKVKNSRHRVIFLIIALTVLLACTSWFASCCAKLGQRVEQHRQAVAWTIFGVFLILVAAGWTGSSWQIFAKSPAGQSFLNVEGSTWQIRSPASDRGDEWGVITPAALAQLNHDPQFPIVNDNLGLDGQNMGVIGMFGVPIRQWAALARPATWGYFVLPQRNAMSWQWQIQFWGALMALWWFLNTLRRAQSGRNLALSLSFCMVPYAAGWSNWSLYATLFPVLAFCLGAQVLYQRKAWLGAFLGCCLGWALAAWVLVLYPPWMVIVGSLCTLLFVGWVLDNRQHLTWGKAQWLALAGCVAVAGSLLFSWWMDTREAVVQMRDTVYPGGRQLTQGGGASLHWFLRGYFGLEVFADGIGPASNKPEASSYFFVPLAMVATLLAGCWRSISSKATWVGLTAFVAAYGIYTFVGFPLWLAKVSKWGVMTTNRMDVGLGLAFIVLLALWQRKDAVPRAQFQKINRIGTLGLAAGSAGLAWWVVASIVPDLMPNNSIYYRAAISLACGALAWWLWQGRVFAVVCLLLLIGFGAALGYNPISKAPKSIQLAKEVVPFVQKNSAGLARTLVIDADALPGATLAAVNVPVLNGILYYPHASMWKAMQLPESMWPTVNRYQHLAFVADGRELPAPYYTVEAPRMDAVTVHIDIVNFDFRILGAERVAVHRNNADVVAKSPRLKRLGEFRQYVWFEVLP
ncbi:hypothetical protein [Comamonas sp. SCN 67-35]|uniref:DUF7657 domain-containing protein n=1 Tax=Comamonas sp. SCN 67-35 TaxID=1660096 RepID=UPI0025C08AE0|nr:hypothetical protein [Comamonas sp. SCN 67-35]